MDVIDNSLNGNLVPVLVCDQLDVTFGGVCDEFGFSCHTTMCGFISCAIAMYIAQRTPVTTLSDLKKLLGTLSDPKEIVPLVRDVVDWVSKRREKYIFTHAQEFLSETEEFQYRTTMMGGQEISDWLCNSWSCGNHGSNGEVHFLRNVATGPPCQVEVRFNLDDYRSHADEWEYIIQEFPFYGNDFFVEVPHGRMLTLEQWATEYGWYGLYPGSTPLVADFWGHYGVFIPIVIHPEVTENQQNNCHMLLFFNTLKGWSCDGWQNGPALLHAMQSSKKVDNL